MDMSVVGAPDPTISHLVDKLGFFPSSLLEPSHYKNKTKKGNPLSEIRVGSLSSLASKLRNGITTGRLLALHHGNVLAATLLPELLSGEASNKNAQSNAIEVMLELAKVSFPTRLSLSLPLLVLFFTHSFTCVACLV